MNVIPPIILALATAGDMPPPEAKTEEPVDLPIQCRGSLCIMPAPLLKELLDTHNAQVQEIRDLGRKLEALRESKGCATAPKKSQPLKKERDS